MHSLLKNLILQNANCLKTHKTTQLLLIKLRHYGIEANAAKTSENKATAEPTTQRSLHVAIIGVPNAGKSTFINNLINHRVCPVSSKVHTTRKANKAIYSTGNTQLVLLDTPGLVTQREIAKHNLEHSFKNAYRQAVQQADAIAVLHDVSNSWTRKALHSTVLDTLKAHAELPSFLILNKIDALKSKRVLLELIRTLTNDTLSVGGGGVSSTKRRRTLTANLVASAKPDDNGNWSNFADVFLVSAITGNGMREVHDYLINNAKPRNWQFAGNSFTDDSPESLIVESVRARLLDYLPQEIPYNLRSVLEFYSMENDIIYASVQVICPSARLERLICGESNGRLRQITERVSSDLVETFGKAISLTIVTKAARN